MIRRPPRSTLFPYTRSPDLPRLGSRDRGGGRVLPAHFTNEEDVDILTERRGKRRRKIFCVDAYFSLVDKRLLGFENIFDRVFNRDNVLHALGVDEIDESCERRCLALADRTDDEEESLRTPREGREDIRKVEFREAFDDLGNEPERYGDCSALKICVTAETHTILALECKVHLLLREEALFLLRREK